jgi:hypothetical protein
MQSTMAITRMEIVLDALYDGQPTVARGQIFTAAELAEINDDLMAYFSRLPDGSYTRDQLDDTINSMIDADGRDLDVGHIT